MRGQSITAGAARPPFLRRRLATAGTLGLAALLPASASANAGVPMLAVIWPVSWLAFIPVVLIEALVAMRLLRLSIRDALSLSMAANLRSTFFGIPVTWGVLVIIELGVATVASSVHLDTRGPVTRILLAPFLAPWFGPTAYPWMVYAAAAFLCIPLFFMSVRVEAWSARKTLPAEQARRWAFWANTATYAPATACLLIATLFALAVPDVPHWPSFRQRRPVAQAQGEKAGDGSAPAAAMPPASADAMPR